MFKENNFNPTEDQLPKKINTEKNNRTRSSSSKLESRSRGYSDLPTLSLESLKPGLISNSSSNSGTTSISPQTSPTFTANNSGSNPNFASSSFILNEEKKFIRYNDGYIIPLKINKEENIINCFICDTFPLLNKNSSIELTGLKMLKEWSKLYRKIYYCDQCKIKINKAKEEKGENYDNSISVIKLSSNAYHHYFI